MTLDCYDFCLLTLGRFKLPKTIKTNPIEDFEGEETDEHQVLRRNCR